MGYYIGKTIELGFDKAVEKVTKTLELEGFGVLTEISIHEKLREKLNVDFRKYKILGACNPSYALEALKAEDKIGTMLPCNVIVQELSNGLVEVAAVDPIASMVAVKNDSLVGIASEIRGKLYNVIEML